MSAMVFPFERLFRDLLMQATKLKIDTEVAPADLIDSVKHTILVRGIGREKWTSAYIDVTVEIPIQEVRTLKIDESRMSVLLQLTCGATDVRATERLKVIDGRAHGTIAFKRDLVANRVMLIAILCEEGTDGIPRILKESQSWEVLVGYEDRSNPTTPKNPGTKGLLRELFDVRWRDFEQEKPLKPYSNELYFVDVSSAERPAIYLNKAIQSYAALLSARPGSSAQEKALRDLEYRRVAMGSWFAATIHALEGIDIDEITGDVTLPEGWRRDVLDLILNRFRPNQSVEMTARSIARGRADGNGYSLLLGQIQSTINKMLDVTSILRRHLDLIGQHGSELGTDQ